jgi:hypothetical protein
MTMAELPDQRSRITNGKLFPRAKHGGVDRRCGPWARRFRDVQNLLLSDRGGPDVASEGEKMLIRRAATLVVELELLEVKIAREGQAHPNAAGNVPALLK